MELHRLARRDAHAVIGVNTCDRIERQPLRGATHATRHADPNHELIGGFEALQAAFCAQIAVVLLITAVELDELSVVLTQRAGHRIRQAFEDRAAQMAAGSFDALNGRERI